MSFSFISNTESIIRQNLAWGIGLGIIGLVLFFYAFSKDKSTVYLLASGLILFAGGWLGYQSYVLTKYGGDWEISIENEKISWNSPNEMFDNSFELQLSRIEHVLVESIISRPDTSNEYTLVTGNQNYKLKTVSGINLKEFTEKLIELGVTRKDVERDPEKK